MNNEWKTFLESVAARIDDETGVHFDNAEIAPTCALSDLSHFGLIRVSGEDAEQFLQGQFTNDITKVTDTHSQLSSYCTPKGRMLASFRIFKLDGHYLLQMPRATHANVMKRLPMFILMSKVTVTDASDELVSIGITGKCAQEALQSNFSSLPQNAGDATNEGGMSLLCLPGKNPRYQVTGEAAQISELWKASVEAGAQASDRTFWALQDIRAGIPWVESETIEAFVPQMINLQLIDGVSFTKGCYTGQEVVARMKYLGKLKRRMYLAKVESNTAPEAGEELFSSSSASGQGAGKVVNVATSPAGGYELLAVTEIAAHDSNDLHIGDSEGPGLDFISLPYSFDEA